MQALTRRKRSLVGIFTVAAVLFVAAAFPVRAHLAHEEGQRMSNQSQQVQFLELLWLQPNVPVDKAADYFQNRLGPILKKHNGEIIQSYQVASTMKGELKPAWINVFRFRSMEDMQAIFQDAEYNKLVPLRDATFDLSQHRLFSVMPVGR